VSKVFYSPDYSEGSFDTVAKAADLAADLIANPILGVEIVAPDIIDPIRLPHSRAYVEAVLTGKPKRLAESAGVADWSPALRDSVMASTSGMVAAAEAAWSDGVAGSLSAGLHHARWDMGGGFCTFNGIAAAARAFHRLGARHVLVIDFDAHHGGGTHDILFADRGVSSVDVAVDSFDNYRATFGWHTVTVRHAHRYMHEIERALAVGRLSGRTRVDAVVYNAGVDPWEHDAIGGMRGITAEMLRERDALVFDTFKGRAPVAWALAGGYSVGKTSSTTDVVSLHRQTVEESAR
jgi:acetoin utilization deacetylase AcuC-like enzyme